MKKKNNSRARPGCCISKLLRPPKRCWLLSRWLSTVCLFCNYFRLYTGKRLPVHTGRQFLLSSTPFFSCFFPLYHSVCLCVCVCAAGEKEIKWVFRAPPILPQAEIKKHTARLWSADSLDSWSRYVMHREFVHSALWKPVAMLFF